MQVLSSQKYLIELAFLVISCIHVKDFEVSLECCNIALAIKPNKAKLHYLKSVTLECLNRKEEA